MTAKELTAKGSRPGKGRKRQLPERYRPLALLCEAANLVSVEQIRVVKRVVTHLNQALRSSSDAVESWTYMRLAANVMRVVAPEAARHPAALAALSEITGSAFLTQARDDDARRFHLVHALADTGAVLREAALLSVRMIVGNVEHNAGHAASLATNPLALGVVDGKIRLINRPAWMLLLPLLDGLEVGRLQICERCERLYVAARRDQLGCSATCGDTLYMRRYRNPDYRKRNEPGGMRRIARETYQLLKRGKK